MTAAGRGFPRAFGTYVLLGSLGRGGMGDVFLARRGSVRGAERLCVLKTTRTDLASGPAAAQEYANRFLDEARLAVALAHANICHVFDVGRVGDELYIAMEHIAGITVRVLVEGLTSAGKSLPPSHAIYLVTELLDALDYAHRRVHPVTQVPLQIVHRDVSPQNVMVTFEGEVKLIDFGLALSKLKKEETSAEVVMGKLSYMSPEQMRGDVVDARTDQFAAGIVLYELLSGVRYYGSLDRAAVVAAAVTGNFRPAGFRDLDDDIARILNRAVNGRREERYESCDAFAAELRALLARRQVGMSRTALRDLIRHVLPNAISDHEALVAALAAPSSDWALPSTLDAQQQRVPTEPTIDLPPTITDGLLVLPPPSTGATAEPTLVLPRTASLSSSQSAVLRLPAGKARTRAIAVGAALVTLGIGLALAYAFATSSDERARTGASDAGSTASASATAPPMTAPTTASASATSATSATTQPSPVSALGNANDDADGAVDGEEGDADGEPEVAREPGRVTRAKTARTQPKTTSAASKAAAPATLPPAAVMWRALEQCTQVCAKGLVAGKARGAPVDDGVLGKCYIKCAKGP